MAKIRILKRLRTKLLLSTLAVSLCAIFSLAIVFNRFIQSEIRDRQAAEHQANLAQADATLIAASERLESLIHTITQSRSFETFSDGGDVGPIKELLFSLKDHDGFLLSDAQGRVLHFNGAWPGKIAGDWSRHPDFRAAQAKAGNFIYSWMPLENRIYLLITYFHKNLKGRPIASLSFGLDVNHSLWAVLLAAENSRHRFVLDTGLPAGGRWSLRLRGAAPSPGVMPAGISGKVRGEEGWYDFRSNPLQKFGAVIHSLQLQEIADAPIHRARRVVAAASLTTAVFLAAALFLLTRRLLARLHLLSEATRHTDQEHLDARIAVTGEDEISQLIVAFNDMVSRLRGAREKISTTNEQLVDEITESYRLSEKLQATQIRLAQARKMESVGKIVGGVVHDFNNILATILGVASIMKEQLGEGGAERKTIPVLTRELETLTTTAERGAALNRKLMVFCRHDSLQKSMVNLNDCVLQVTERNESRLPPQISLNTRLQEKLTSVEGNSEALCQAIQNVVANAFEAMPTGGHLELRTESVVLEEESATAMGLAPGKYVQLVVKDTGCGIPEEIRDQVFEPFLTTKGVGIGTGLGLSVVFGVLRNHEGAVSFETEQGKGTEFRFYLPAHEAPV